MFRDTITVFNRRREEAGDTWYPTVLEGVDLNVDHAALVAKYGSSCSDKAVLHVKYDWHGGPKVCGKAYLTPMLWQAAEDPAKAVTFQTGEAFDFFIEGAWEGAELGPVRENDWPRGFYDHMNRTRDGVWAVTAASRYSIIRHFEVTGK